MQKREQQAWQGAVTDSIGAFKKYEHNGCCSCALVVVAVFIALIAFGFLIVLGVRAKRNNDTLPTYGKKIDES